MKADATTPAAVGWSGGDPMCDADVGSAHRPLACPATLQTAASLPSGAIRQRHCRTGRSRGARPRYGLTDRCSATASTVGAGTTGRRSTLGTIASLANIAHLRFRLSRRAGEREGKRSAAIAYPRAAVGAALCLDLGGDIR